MMRSHRISPFQLPGNPALVGRGSSRGDWALRRGRETSQNPIRRRQLTFKVIFERKKRKTYCLSLIYHCSAFIERYSVGMNDELSQELEKVKRVSGFLRGLFLLGLVFVLLVFLFSIIILAGVLPDSVVTESHLSLNDVPIDVASLGPGAKLVAAVFLVIHFGFAAVICWEFSRLFGSFTREEIYTSKTVRILGNIGRWLIIVWIAGVIGPFLVMSFSGENSASLSFDFSLLFVGVILFLLSWIFEVGRKQHEENALTI